MAKDETRLLCMPCLRGLAFITGIALATGLRAAPLTTASELAAVIRRFLADCTAEQRGIFLRRYWYFDTIPAVAAHFGCTESKVKVTLHRLRERLRAVLEEEGWTV